MKASKARELQKAKKPKRIKAELDSIIEDIKFSAKETSDNYIYVR